MAKAGDSANSKPAAKRAKTGGRHAKKSLDEMIVDAERRSKLAALHDDTAVEAPLGDLRKFQLEHAGYDTFEVKLAASGLLGWVTALHRTILLDDAQAFEALLPRSDVNARDALGRTPLMLAASSSNDAMFNALLPTSDPKAVSVEGNTALILAASRGTKEMVRALIPVSDVKAAHDQGFTALMHATEATWRPSGRQSHPSTTVSWSLAHPSYLRPGGSGTRRLS